MRIFWRVCVLLLVGMLAGVSASAQNWTGEWERKYDGVANLTLSGGGNSYTGSVVWVGTLPNQGGTASFHMHPDGTGKLVGNGTADYHDNDKDATCTYDVEVTMEGDTLIEKVTYRSRNLAWKPGISPYASSVAVLGTTLVDRYKRLSGSTGRPPRQPSKAAPAAASAQVHGVTNPQGVKVRTQGGAWHTYDRYKATLKAGEEMRVGPHSELVIEQPNGTYVTVKSGSIIALKNGKIVVIGHI